MNDPVDTLAKQGQHLADAAANEAAPRLRQATARVQSMAEHGFDAVSDMAGRTRDAVASASQSIIGYTRENPVKALMIAAVSGALMLTAAKAVRKSARD